MNLSSFATTYKEKKSYIEVTIFTDYFFKKGNEVYTGHKKNVIKIVKPTKKEIIKEAKNI